MLETICLGDIRNNEKFTNFVDNLVLFMYCEKGDVFSHLSIAFSAVFLFLEAYNL